MKKPVFLLLFTFITTSIFAQQFGLYNTRTLYDAFENPSQEAFQVDSSRKYAFNFFIPTVGIHGTFLGPAQQSFKDLAFRRLINGDLPIGEQGSNTLLVNSNNYLLMFRVLKNVRWNRELGFSWQIRQHANIEATNETLVLLDNVRRFSSTEQLALPDMFNNKGFNQAYHQFSMTFREDLDKRTGLGVKLSALSGITYNKFNIRRSSIRMEEDVYAVNMSGTYRSSFGFDTLDINTALPLFKNPGLSFSLSANHKGRDGWYFLGNLKDLGLIRWSNTASRYDFNGDLIVENTNSSGERRDLLKDVKSFVVQNSDKGAFLAPTDARVEFLVEKDLDWFRPNLVLSKSVFFPEGDVALINHLRYKDLIFSVSGNYNFNNFFQLGTQAMYKTPNFELFVGSDQLFKTYYSAKNILFKTAANGKGYTAASMYFGLALKFGPVQEHPLNARSIPGIDNNGQANQGVFKRLLSKLKGRKDRNLRE